MSTNEPPTVLIKNEADHQSSSGSLSRVRVEGYDDRDTRLFTEPTSGSSSPQATPSPDLPRPPLQVHIHCYPSTQRNLQNASGGNRNLPDRRRTIDNPSLSSSPNVSGKILDTLADAALSAATSDATGGGILLQVPCNSEQDTENLPFPATAVTNDTKRRFRSRIVSCLFLLVVGSIIVIRILA